MPRKAGFKLTQEHKDKIGLANYRGGKKFPNCQDCNKKLRNNQAKRCKSCSKSGVLHPQFGVRGELSHAYIGNSTKPERQKLMAQFEYRIWRQEVFKRDSYTCIQCEQVGGVLNAHHIKPWKDFPDLRYEVSNGVTLCKRCHYEVHHA